MQDLFVDGSFASLSQGFGAIGTDRQLDFYANQQNYSQQELDVLFEINNFAANIIEYLPQAMGQKPAVFEFLDQNDESLTPVQKEIQAKINRVTAHFIKAYTLARHCGGAGLFLGNSDEDLSQILTGQCIYYTVFEGGFGGVLRIAEIDYNPISKTYEKPLKYRLRGLDSEIHGSRIIPFYGIHLLTRRQRQFYQHWGRPVLVRCYEKLRNLDVADQSISNTISQFSRLVMEVDNLTTLLSNESGRATLKERIQLISYSWNTLKTLILNKGEKVYNLKVDYTGLDSILSHFKEVLAGSADIPYSKLFNSSGGGSALSGSSAGSGSMDRSAERQWSDYVNSKQTNDWLPGIEKLVRIWLSDLGFNFAGYPYKIEFPSILQLTESEEAGLEKTKAETAKIKSETT